MSECKRRRPKKPTNGKCSNFINGNCSYNCPNAALEGANVRESSMCINTIEHLNTAKTV